MISLLVSKLDQAGAEEFSFQIYLVRGDHCLVKSVFSHTTVTWSAEVGFTSVDLLFPFGDLCS